MVDLPAFLVFGAGLLATVGAGEGLRAIAGWRPEASRRFVHTVTGLLVAASPILFARPTGIYALAALFIAVNLWAVPRRVFPGMHAIRRRSWGTVTFPLALLVALWTCWTLDGSRVYILQIAFVVLAVADPLASAVGERWSRSRRYRLGTSIKSLAGSTAFFLATAAIVAVGLMLAGIAPVIAATGATVAAVLATGAEAFAGRGWDNFFLVLAVIVPLTWLHEGTSAMLLGGALLVAAVFGSVAFAVRSLDASGMLAASGLAFSVVVPGPAWVAPGVTFFVLSSALSKVGRRRKATAETLAEKGSRRDAGQVFANGGVAWALLVAYTFVPIDPLYWGFVGAFAAAAADTWGTEIGTLVGGPTRQVWSGRRVPPGTSGGVSVAGTVGALAGASVVLLSALFFVETSPALLVTAGVIGGGVAASLVDSLIGATAQALYRDADGHLTERPEADGRENPLVRGRVWVTNDRVNLACTCTGAIAAAAASFF